MPFFYVYQLLNLTDAKVLHLYYKFTIVIFLIYLQKQLIVVVECLEKK